MIIELSEDQISKLVAEELEDTLKFFEEELATGHSTVFYWNNSALEAQELLKYIEAAKLLLDWYK